MVHSNVPCASKGYELPQDLFQLHKRWDTTQFTLAKAFFNHVLNILHQNIFSQIFFHIRGLCISLGIKIWAKTAVAITTCYYLSIPGICHFQLNFVFRILLDWKDYVRNWMHSSSSSWLWQSFNTISIPSKQMWFDELKWQTRNRPCCRICLISITIAVVIMLLAWSSTADWYRTTTTYQMIL